MDPTNSDSLELEEFIWNLKRLLREGYPEGIHLYQLESMYRFWFEYTVKPEDFHQEVSDWKTLFTTLPKLMQTFVANSTLVKVLPGQETSLEELRMVLKSCAYKNIFRKKHRGQKRSNTVPVVSPLTSDNSPDDEGPFRFNVSRNVFDHTSLHSSEGSHSKNLQGKTSTPKVIKKQEKDSKDVDLNLERLKTQVIREYRHNLQNIVGISESKTHGDERSQKTLLVQPLSTVSNKNSTFRGILQRFPIQSCTISQRPQRLATFPLFGTPFSHVRFLAPAGPRPTAIPNLQPIRQLTKQSNSKNLPVTKH